MGESESEDFLLGHTDSSKHYLFTHFDFLLGFNGAHVVSANVTVNPDARADITLHDPTHEDVPDLGSSKASRLGGHAHKGGARGGAGEKKTVKVKFSYSVRWAAVDTPYEARMAVYEESAFLPATLEIHWLSIVNSLVLVLLLTAFLAIILLRVIRNDFTRYMRADDDLAAGEEESGWKLLHGDVFRAPPALSLFAAFVGAGVHLLVTTLLLLSLSLFGTFSLARRGSIVAACIVLYVLTAFIGGYASARLFHQLKGGAWVWNVVLALLVVPVPFGATFSVLNTTALVKNSTAALPWGTIFVVLALFCLIAVPLTVLGGIAGHNSPDYEPPCRIAKVPRQIPEQPLYRSLAAQLFMAGFLPFSAISIELHYIFASVWGHKVRARAAVACAALRCCAPRVPPAASARPRVLVPPPPAPAPTTGLHVVWHPLPCLWPARARDVLHHRGADVLSAELGRPRVVVALLPLGRLRRRLHLRLLLLLLLQPQRHERRAADGLLLHLHGGRGLCLLPHDGRGRLLLLLALREVYLLQHQDRLRRQRRGLSS